MIICRTDHQTNSSIVICLLLKTSAEQNAQHSIPVQHSLVTSVAMPSAVSTIQYMPVNSSVTHFSPPIFVPPPFPLPVAPYICLPPETHFPVRQDVSSESGSIQSAACPIPVVERRSSQDSSRYIRDTHVSVEERIQESSVGEPLQQPMHDKSDERRSSDRLDDTSYRDKVLDDDISRERLEKRLMKEKVEKWRIRDGIDSDRVEFERLRTPHRNVIDAGMFSAFLHL